MTQPNSIIVNLAASETKLARELGMKRNESAKASRKRDRFGLKSNQLDVHVLGVSGEIAAAKALGVEFSPTVDTYRTVPDVGIYEVRTRSKINYELLIRDDDKNDSIFILVRSNPSDQLDRFEVVGWLKGKDGKNNKWKKNHGGRPPAYFIPDSALRDMAELKQHIKEDCV